MNRSLFQVNDHLKPKLLDAIKKRRENHDETESIVHYATPKRQNCCPGCAIKIIMAQSHYSTSTAVAFTSSPVTTKPKSKWKKPEDIKKDRFWRDMCTPKSIYHSPTMDLNLGQIFFFKCIMDTFQTEEHVNPNAENVGTLCGTNIAKTVLRRFYDDSAVSTPLKVVVKDQIRSHNKIVSGGSAFKINIAKQFRWAFRTNEVNDERVAEHNQLHGEKRWQSAITLSRSFLCNDLLKTLVTGREAYDQCRHCLDMTTEEMQNRVHNSM